MGTSDQQGRRYLAFAETPRDIPLIVVDLGYSARKKSCGLYWTGAERHKVMTFGDTIRQTAELIRGMNNPLLVVEAPLSMFHGPKGNPDVRGAFERGRGWYYGAGVLTFAGANRFLNALSGLFVGELLLAEAFLSNKDSRTQHGVDAVQIHNGFWSTSPALLQQGIEVACPLIAGIPSVRVFGIQPHV